MAYGDSDAGQKFNQYFFAYAVHCTYLRVVDTKQQLSASKLQFVYFLIQQCTVHECTRIYFEHVQTENMTLRPDK